MSSSAAPCFPGLLPATTEGPDATEEIGRALAASLGTADVLALYGDLGAGKTRLVRGLVAGLGGDPDTVSSPTFTLVHTYPTAGPPLVHIDAYRLSHPDDFRRIGGDELLEDAAVITVIEWPERIQTLLSRQTLCVTLTHAGGDRRHIREGVPEQQAPESQATG